MTLTLDKEHLNLFALNLFAKEYHRANFHDDCSENVRENAVVTGFPILSARVTLNESHLY